MRTWSVLFSVSMAVAGCGGALPYFQPLSQDYDGGDWNQAGGGHTGRSYRPLGIEPPLRLLWEQTMDAPPLGGSIVSGQLVLQMTKRSSLYSFDLGTGEELGKRGYGELPCAAPIIAGPAAGVLIVAEFSPNPLLKAVSRVDGSTLWSRGQVNVCADLVVHADTVVIVDEEGTVAALGAMEGDVIWELRDQQRYSSGPAVFENLVFVGDTVGAVRALRLVDGEEKWHTSLGASLRTRPAVSSKGVFLGTGAGEVVALSTATGDETWRTKLGGLSTPGFALSDDILVTGSVDRHVYGLDVDSGDILWRFETNGVVRGTPVSTESVVYCGSGDGFIYALELGSGSLLWKYRLDGPALAPLALGPRSLIVATETGSIYVFGRG